MIEWLKKHWELIAFSGVGILVLYWLYKTYQENQASQADTTANADSLASAEQVANAGYGGFYSGSGGGGGGGSTIAPPQTSPVASPVSSPISTTISDPPSGGGFLSVADAMATLPADHQNGDYSFSQNSAVPNNPNPIYVLGSPQAIALGYSPDPNASVVSSAVSTLFGSGGGNNDTAPVAIQASQPDVPLSHISDGTIPSHTILVKSPTNTELSSLGGRV